MLMRSGCEKWNVASLPPPLKLWRTSARPWSVASLARPWSVASLARPTAVGTVGRMFRQVLARGVVDDAHAFLSASDVVTHIKRGVATPVGLASEAALHGLAREAALHGHYL
jgi:hypothetical protein